MSIFTKVGGAILKPFLGKGLVNVDFDQIQDKEAERRLAWAGFIVGCGIAAFLILCGIAIVSC